MPLLLIAAEASFELLVPRSYAATAVEDLAGRDAGGGGARRARVSYSGGRFDHGMPSAAIWRPSA